MVPAAFGAGVYQITVFTNTLFQSLLEEGTVSYLYNADRLIQLPIGIFSIALASVLLPTLASAAAAKDHSGFEENLSNALRFTSFVILPTAAGIFFFSEELISVMFERGAFDVESTRKTALVVKTLALGIWPVSCHSMVIRAFIARQDTRTPAYIAVLTLLVNLPLAICFMGPPVSNATGFFGEVVLSAQELLKPITISWRHAGLGLASSISATCGLVVTVFLLKRKYAVNLKSFIEASLKALLGTCLLIIVWDLFSDALHPSWLRLLIGALLGTGLYIGTTLLLRSREAIDCAKLFFKAVRRI